MNIGTVRRVQATISYLKRQVELAAAVQRINPRSNLSQNGNCVWCHRFYTSPSGRQEMLSVKMQEVFTAPVTSQVIDVHGLFRLRYE